MAKANKVKGENRAALVSAVLADVPAAIRSMEEGGTALQGIAQRLKATGITAATFNAAAFQKVLRGTIAQGFTDAERAALAGKPSKEKTAANKKASGYAKRIGKYAGLEKAAKVDTDAAKVASALKRLAGAANPESPDDSLSAAQRKAISDWLDAFPIK